MTYKEIFKEYLEKKAEILSQFSKESYMLDQDWQYLEVFTEDFCRHFLLYVLCDASDTAACPFCIFYSRCSICTYSINHGNCIKAMISSYRLILADIKKIDSEFLGITSIPMIKDLIKSTRAKAKNLLHGGIVEEKNQDCR